MEEEAFAMFWWSEFLEEENIVQCSRCGKEILENEAVHCNACVAPLCGDCGYLGVCSNYTEVWEAEENLGALEEGW